MKKKNKVVEFLIKKNKHFNKTSNWNFLQGNFDFANEQVIQNAGSVYGVFIKIPKEDLDKLPDEYCKDTFKYGNYYVLYWGKDVHPQIEYLNI